MLPLLHAPAALTLMIIYRAWALLIAQESAASRPPRFYVEAQLPSHAGEAVELDPDESKHATKALRLTEGAARNTPAENLPWTSTSSG